MSSEDTLGNRMKGYEIAARSVLPNRMPVIVRVDGKAFHTYTRQCRRPFDDGLSRVMQLTAMELCKQLQGAQIAYVQSDEISVLLHSYKKFASEAWFDNQVQKMTSVAAGIASAYFSVNSYLIWGAGMEMHPDTDTIQYVRPAVFDARAFVLPESEVCNYFLWRQQDATRNSVQMLARSMYSHKECDNKNVNELRAMCREKKVGWDELATYRKHGACIVKKQVSAVMPLTAESFIRTSWDIDLDIPVFSQDREYINRLLVVEEE